MAYGVQDYQIDGPEWLRSAKFDIVAKIPAGSPRNQLPAMMMALLVERFHMKRLPRVERDGTSTLWWWARAPKLQQVKPGGTSMSDNENNNSRKITGEGVSMALLAETLARIVEHPVVDRTGLQGVYSLKLEYTQDNAKSDGADGGWPLDLLGAAGAIGAEIAT